MTAEQDPFFHELNDPDHNHEVASQLTVIPPDHLYRTLVLCFDGTGDQFDADNSNIVEFFSMLKKDDRDHQMVYYQAGIGTYITPEIATPFAAKVSKILDEAIAWNLNAHVMDGYQFLMQNYQAGDRICIFGFSRGAYTARALAGMIHKVGLLPACNHQQVPFAYKMFTRADEKGWRQSNAFKHAFSVDVKIEFLGVWDTVCSVGLISRRLPFTASNTIVRTFRHAISLDERRAKFRPNFWNVPSEIERALGSPGQAPDHEKRKRKVGRNVMKALERRYSEHADRETDVEEVWFAGCHCDVGGGSVENNTPNTLARIPLRWMVRECFRAKSGIMFTTGGLQRIGLDPEGLYPIVKPRPEPLSPEGRCVAKMPTHRETAKVKEKLGGEEQEPLAVIGSEAQRPLLSTSTAASAEATSAGESEAERRKTEEEHELLDALAPMYDQLSIKPWLWGFLELLPLRHRYQVASGKWEKHFRPNLGRPRYIPRQRKGVIRVHRSVKTRMEAEAAATTTKGKHGGHEKKYIPRADFSRAEKAGNLVWVD